MFRKVLLGLFTLLVLISGLDFSLLASETDDYVFNTTLTRRVGVVGKIFEKAGLFLKFNPVSKSIYWRKLVDKRLAEMKLVVEQDRLDIFEQTSSRYSTYLGRYSNYIVSKNLTSQKKIAEQMFNKHTEILKPLRDKYEYDSGWWLMLQQNIDTIDILKKIVEEVE